MKAISFALLVVCLTSTPGAQEVRADETAIRALIDEMSAGKPLPRTADQVFWSGAMTRPIVGDEPAIEKTGPRSLANRLPGSQRTKVTPVRIEVSRSGDLAWEYSNAVISFQMKDGSHVQFDASILRVWRKTSGKWSVAANFTQPHGE